MVKDGAWTATHSLAVCWSRHRNAHPSSMLADGDLMLPSLLSTSTSLVEFWKVYVAEMSLIHTYGDSSSRPPNGYVPSIVEKMLDNCHWGSLRLSCQTSRPWGRVPKPCG